MPNRSGRGETALTVPAAIFIVGAFWLPSTTTGGDWASTVTGAVLATGTAAAMLLRRRFPAHATATAGIATLTGTILGVCDDPMLGTAWCLYPLAVACAARTRTFVLGVACLVAGLAVVSAVPEGVSLGRRVLVSGAALSVAWLVGTSVGRQILTARQAERARVQLAVARDVHDVVGHALGVICAEAGVTRMLPDADEEELRDTLADVEAHARSALEEVQALVRGLRTEQAAPLAQLSAVVTATRAAGVGVRNRVDLARPVGDAVGTTVVRIVQEALSNVIRHAPGATCTVDVHDDGKTVVVRVRDDGPGAGLRDGGAGVGLHGIRERAGLLGGSASWRDHPDGGFEVVAHLPAGATR